jgi:NitT/TauT family transport system substrate-binding protein
MRRATSMLLLLGGVLPLLGASLAASPVAAQGSLGRMKIGTSGGLNTAIQPVLYAKSAGLFEKAGLAVETTDMVDDTTAVQALIGGQFDMLYTGAGTGMTAISRGADIKLVMSFAPWVDYLFLAPKGLNSLKEMEGKVLGVSKVGSLSHLAPVLALQREGVDVSKIRIVAIGNDAVRGQALAAGTINGAVLNGINAAQTLAAKPELHVIYNVGAVFRDSFMSTAVFARGAAIRDNPKAVGAAVKALIQASRDLQSNKRVAVEQAKRSGLPEPVSQATYDLLLGADVPYYGVDGGVNRKAVESTVQLLKEGNSLEKTPSFEEIVDPQFVNQALKDLGPYKP